MKTLFRLIFASIFFSFPTQSQTRELMRTLQNEMKKQHVAGMSLTIIKNDSILFEGGLGFSGKTRINGKHLFRQASITKLFMGLGILRLQQQGLLRLNDRLSLVAPEIKFTNKWEKENPITILNLLEHSTCFSDKSPFEEYNFSSPQKADLAVFKKFMTSKLPPGSCHMYSSVNYAILDYIIQKLTHHTTNEFVRKNVFEPLGMLRSNLHLKPDVLANYALGSVYLNDHYVAVPHNASYFAGYASMNSCAADLCHALKYFLRPDNPIYENFLSLNTLLNSEIPSSYLSAHAGHKNTYAVGNEASEFKAYIFRGHRGAIGGFLSAFQYNRELKIGYAFSINTHNETFYNYADDLIRNFLTKNCISKPKQVNSPINAKVAKTYEGYYRLANPSQLYSGFFDGLTNTINLNIMKDHIKTEVISKETLEWWPADDSGLIYHSGSINPDIIFTKDHENRPAIAVGQMFFTKLSPMRAWSSILLFSGSTLISISYLLFFIPSLALVLFSKISKKQLLFRFFPLIGVFCLFCFAYVASQLFDYMRMGLSPHHLYIVWSFAKICFALYVPIFLCRIMFQKEDKLVKVYLFLFGLSQLYLLIVFLTNGWYRL